MFLVPEIRLVLTRKFGNFKIGFIEIPKYVWFHVSSNKNFQNKIENSRGLDLSRFFHVNLAG